MRQYIDTFMRYRSLLTELVSRDLKTKYRRSALGFMWSVLNPLGMMVVLTIVFSTVFQQAIPNFPVYLMCGQLTFNFFNEASNMAMTSVLDNAPLIKKVYVPKYLFPLSRVCSSLVNMLTSFVALMIVILITRTPITWTIFLSVFPICFATLFSLGIGLILSVVVVTFRDMKHLYSVITTAWLYLTPVFYPISMLPDSVAVIVRNNPLTLIVEILRYNVLYHQVAPFVLVLKTLIYCAVAMILGLWMFKKTARYLHIEIIGGIGLKHEENVIEVENVSLQFRLYKEKVDSIKEYVLKRAKRELEYENFWALKDISFDVKKGEAVGLVGKNGSGKSTMLKVIAGVIKPTFGEVRKQGSVAPMIELGAGFDFDLTARENIYLNGAILGYPKEMLREMEHEIIEFAELEKFADVPVKNFSSGMVTRLGFSIATIYKPDILIVDEILSVGDFRFQAKCEERIGSMLESGTTLLLVSHSTEQVRRICDKAVLINHGNMLLHGDVDEVCDMYTRL
jgi:ABC-type polysaccharide/polyol phosphate transport system ATPase subunit/ABC-type polysaccharide/polyol phosphate export permease